MTTRPAIRAMNRPVKQISSDNTAYWIRKSTDGINWTYCNGPDDLSPEHTGEYNHACACCFLELNHTEEYHTARSPDKT